MTVRSLGFTGTRRGMTDAQKERITALLLLFHPRQAHHGDCIGADKQFHELVQQVLPATEIIVHPPDNERLRAYCVGEDTWPAKSYLVRDRI